MWCGAGIFLCGNLLCSPPRHHECDMIQTHTNLSNEREVTLT
nr:MAG TPA_asm: hypothetical protein [Caudoviricetes sp.]